MLEEMNTAAFQEPEPHAPHISEAEWRGPGEELLISSQELSESLKALKVLESLAASCPSSAPEVLDLNFNSEINSPQDLS